MKKQLLIFLLMITTGISAWCKITPAQLTCENMSEPPVIDVLNPRLSWISIAGISERGRLKTSNRHKAFNFFCLKE